MPACALTLSPEPAPSHPRTHKHRAAELGLAPTLSPVIGRTLPGLCGGARLGSVCAPLCGALRKQQPPSKRARSRASGLPSGRERARAAQPEPRTKGHIPGSLHLPSPPTCPVLGQETNCTRSSGPQHAPPPFPRLTSPPPLFSCHPLPGSLDQALPPTSPHPDATCLCPFGPPVPAPMPALLLAEQDHYCEE